MDELLQVMMKHSSTMNEQAITYKMNPNETPAAIMIELINEYYVTYKTRIDSKNQIFRGMATEHPDVMSQILAALASGDTKRYSDLISQNPEFLDSFIDKMAENELKKEFKAKLETTLRDLIIENLNESNEIPEMFKGLMVKKVAGTFCKNTKDDYAKFKSNFTKIWNKAGLSQNEYYSIVDEVTIKVLDEFIEPPKRSEY